MKGILTRRLTLTLLGFSIVMVAAVGISYVFDAREWKTETDANLQKISDEKYSNMMLARAVSIAFVFQSFVNDM